MEVSIFEAVGLPEGAILSVRAGSTRRQAPVPLAGPLRFPNLPFNAKQFKVDVMQTLGSSKVEINANKELESYSVAVDVGNGQQARVGFTVREQPSLCGKRACELKQVDKNPEGLAEEPTAMQLPPEKARAALDSRNYAREHNIPNLVQEMLQHVLREKPDAPFMVMSEYFKRKGEEMGEKGENAKSVAFSNFTGTAPTAAPGGTSFLSEHTMRAPTYSAAEATLPGPFSSQSVQQRVQREDSLAGEFYIPNVPDEDPHQAFAMHKAAYADPYFPKEEHFGQLKAIPGAPPPTARVSGEAHGGPPPLPGRDGGGPTFGMPGDSGLKAAPPGPGGPHNFGGYSGSESGGLKGLDNNRNPDFSFGKAPPAYDADPMPRALPPQASAGRPGDHAARSADPERAMLEAEHLKLHEERAALLKELEMLAAPQDFR